MAVDTHKNYPHNVLEDSYACATGEAIVAGCFTILNSVGKLERAVGGADEYAMLAMTAQPTNFMEQGEKVQVVKENGSFWTTEYKVGPSYVPGCKLQVSTSGSEKGILTLHAGGSAPVVGRYQEVATRKEQSMMRFDLVRN